MRAGESRARPVRRRSRHQRGSASVLMTVFAGVLVVAALAAAVAAGLFTGQRRVESAADLAALAGAAAAVTGGPAGLDRAGSGAPAPPRTVASNARDGPCAAAAAVAARNRARLDRCTLRARSVLVTVSRVARLPLLGEIRLRAQARAGPDVPAAGS